MDRSHARHGSRPSLARASLALAIVCSAISLPATAATTMTTTNGVEVIVSQPDRTVATLRQPIRARAAHAASSKASVAAARQEVAPTAFVRELRGASTLIATALSFVGTPYVWGGAAPGGFDCSGFTYYAFARLGIAIPRTADVQFAAGRPIVGDPLPGDLVFFQTYDYGASHVGIYLGNGRFVNSIGDNVHVTTFASAYFRERYLGARRFLRG